MALLIVAAVLFIDKRLAKTASVLEILVEQPHILKQNLLKAVRIASHVTLVIAILGFTKRII
jgi:hypothetical protein